MHRTKHLRMLLAVLALLLGLTAQASAQSNDALFFNSEGDLWSWYLDRPADGRLTTWNYNGGPILSPDGSRIAYLSMAREAVNELTSGQAEFFGTPPGNIWVMDTATSRFQQITQQTSYPTLRSLPAWSPVGTELAWVEMNLSDGTYAMELVIHNFSSGQARVVPAYINPGFQDAGIVMPRIQWGPHGISRLLFTFVETGDLHILLEIIQPGGGTSTQFLLSAAPIDGSGDFFSPIDHIWVEQDARAMIALLSRTGRWTILDPVLGGLNELSQPPVLTPRNGSRTTNRTTLTPLYTTTAELGWEIRWRATNPAGSVMDLPYSSFELNSVAPAISPDGQAIAWNLDGAVSYQTFAGDGGIVYYPNPEIFNHYVSPAMAVWTPLRWIVNAASGAPVPTPDAGAGAGSSACDLPTRFAIGSFVTVNPGPPNNVRSGAGLQYRVTQSLPPGALASVRRGPVCADGLRWWEVQTEAFVGWTAEGTSSDQWLIPLSQSPMLNNCPLPPRLVAGGRAVVLPGDPNVLRDGPDANGTLAIGRIPAGGVMRVLGSSLCGTDGRRWFPVDYDGRLGWTAEGEGARYWLEPR